MKRIKYTIFDNVSIDYDEWYKDYIDYCEVNQIETTGYDSKEFWDWAGYRENDDWEWLEYRLDNAIAKQPCVINNKYWKYSDVVMGGVMDAIKSIVSDLDCHIEVTQYCSTIYVRRWCHDDPTGKSLFTINILNDKALDRSDYLWIGNKAPIGEIDLKNRRYFKTLNTFITIN